MDIKAFCGVFLLFVLTVVISINIGCGKQPNSADGGKQSAVKQASGTKYPTIAIVTEGGSANISGKLSFAMDRSGSMRPRTWTPGMVFLFRVNEVVNGEAGKASEIYQLDENLKLKKIGEFDLKKSDDELTEEYVFSENRNSHEAE